MIKDWIAIINNERQKEEIWDSIENIKNALLNQNFENLSPIGLFTGKPGILLFFYEYYKVTRENIVLDRIFIMLNDLYDEIENVESRFNYSLANGLTGIAWLINYISNDGVIEIDSQDILEQLDEPLFRNMLIEVNKPHYDYLHGGGGTALYFMSRPPNAILNGYIKSFFNIVASQAIIDESSKQVKWSDYDHIEDKHLKESFNFGLAHGIPSIISLMTHVKTSHINFSERNFLVEGSVSYLLGNKMDPAISNSIFPWTLTEDDKNHDNLRPSRLAWCYGDMGVALSIFKAGQCLRNKRLIKEAVEVFRHSAHRRILEENMVIDTNLCHGTTGIAHVFNVIYQHTKEEFFKETALFWYEKTLEGCKPSVGNSAGFQTWNGGSMQMEDNYSFLIGIPGIGLSLLASLSSTYPKWDELLLIS